MITVEEAVALVDRRLMPLAGCYAPNESPVSEMFEGTGMPGPGIIDLLKIDVCGAAIEMPSLAAQGIDPLSAFTGPSMRAFWLGYEMGRST